ncbi:hypothetical protein LJ737_11700 [Hymenobacter sp. 15J16-1T3B]|uniref:hypothetical protein n=1 Tax=Hymenobacter sp. 15J16-1T3B TaxID=2886941 RepID=UPI001D1075A4|nr:hypothetical protein [Hymenobacter sp. 15J16-1T3B]MCC3157905.1 hypothetical protein [Hymenobacter sp. 15J16-1T3B]
MLLLPTRNSTADAWYYAACVRYGHDLLLPHHLLYNAVGWLWLRLLGPLHPEAIHALLALNALAYGGVLLGLRQLLRRLTGAEGLRLALLAAAGCSFGLLRFATENETYVLPLLLSVWASVAWLRHLRTATLPPLLLAGLLAAGACLLHQVQACWWLGLLIGTALYSPRRGAGWWFAAPALLVPLAYWLALDYWQLPRTPASLVRFALHDFLTGAAGAPASLPKAALLTVANVVRTFAQVHGSTLALLRRLPGLAAVPVLGLAGVLWAWLRRPRHPEALRSPAALPPAQVRAARRTHGLVMLLHLGFAAWATGNAEFMVMLPVLLALLLTAAPSTLARPLTAAAGALLAWNLAFGLVPNHLLDFTNLPPLLARVRQEPRTWFLLDNHNLALNRLHYLTGRDGQPNVLPAPELLLAKHRWTPAQLQQWLRAQQRGGHRLSTDVLGGPRLLDRAALVRSAEAAELLRGFRPAVRDTFPTFFGPRYLTDLR